MNVKLNCDLGESYGNWSIGNDEAVMPFIDQANIACGFHAGDPMVMTKTIQLAKQHNVEVGAHPSYPDLNGFGRRSMQCSRDELISLVRYQVAAIDGVAKSLDVELSYVKPHGALYNDMMKSDSVRESLMDAVSGYHRPLKLMLQATPLYEIHKEEAEKAGVSLLFEAFADRCYTDEGLLVKRGEKGAVHSSQLMLEQAQLLATEKQVITQTGKRISVAADSLCVHGDNQESIDSVKQIKHILANI
ncbi:5-oxoprolinase subunit PxpA [Alteromonadaceae bacterium M269]|nr:5-oxoprolinase subunit PxpA [Alteromonadaceae bacterium M269]